VTTREPERELVKRVLPFIIPVAVGAFLVATILSDTGAGASAALAILIVAANLIVSATSIAWAATISPVAVYAVGLGGFVLRLTLFFAILLFLKTFAWFSPLAFTATFIPATMALLAFEMRYLASRQVQADLWYFRGQV